MSAALLLLAGTAQRRRPIAGANTADFQSFDDEWLWVMPPYFRKTARKKRSRGRHLVPLIGFAAQAADRLDKLAGEQPWLLPVARPRRIGQQPKLPHVNPRAVRDAIESMPGVEFSSHGLRAALATYGPEDLGWLAADAKLILDHLEGFDAGDVTAQHYNTHPELVKKRAMMKRLGGMAGRAGSQGRRRRPYPARPRGHRRAGLSDPLRRGCLEACGRAQEEAVAGESRRKSSRKPLNSQPSSGGNTCDGIPALIRKRFKSPGEIVLFRTASQMATLSNDNFPCSVVLSNCADEVHPAPAEHIHVSCGPTTTPVGIFRPRAPGVRGSRPRIST